MEEPHTCNSWLGKIKEFEETLKKLLLFLSFIQLFFATIK